MGERMWIVYDSRALTDVDRASVYVACESEREARGYVFDDESGFDDGVCYSYAIGPGNQLIDERFEFAGPLIEGKAVSDE